MTQAIDAVLQSNSLAIPITGYMITASVDIAFVIITNPWRIDSNIV
jgi:hypothetical protein